MYAFLRHLNFTMAEVFRCPSSFNTELLQLNMSSSFSKGQHYSKKGQAHMPCNISVMCCEECHYIKPSLSESVSKKHAAFEGKVKHHAMTEPTELQKQI